jgi:hypothetical protein
MHSANGSYASLTSSPLLFLLGQPDVSMAPVVPIQLLLCCTSPKPLCLIKKRLDVGTLLLVRVKVTTGKMVVELLAVPVSPERLVASVATLAASRHCEIMREAMGFISCPFETATASMFVSTMVGIGLRAVGLSCDCFASSGFQGASGANRRGCTTMR